MTFNSHNSEPPCAEMNEKDASQSQPGTSETEHLLIALLASCSGLETANFRMTLRDRKTEQITFNEDGPPLKLLGYLPECLSRLWHWNEALIIESCDPAQDENLDL